VSGLFGPEHMLALPQVEGEDPELVVTSPGIRPDHPVMLDAYERGIQVWGDVELAWRLNDRAGRPSPKWLCLTGTNGKTTTTKMAVQLLEAQGLKVFTNRTGSNFVRGVAAALLGEMTLTGKLEADIAAAADNKLGYGAGDFIPGLTVDYTIKDKSGTTVQEGTLMPMNASDGPHYGLNLPKLDAGTYDVTFENVQAGLRTDYLFRLANHLGGIVLGTGDLSELALGWCTYGVGDQMSHYAVNTGVPKTLMQHLIRWVVASKQFDDRVGEVLLSILHTEISPELVPAKPGEKMQSTQDKIGPYNLQDFTLYYVLRRGARPSKIAFLAEKAWADASVGSWPVGFPEEDKVAYSLDEIVKWERLFLWRFFSQQFKRSALPNGPKVMAGGSLSPRGDWRMPSDVSGADWVAELDEAVKGLVD